MPFGLYNAPATFQRLMERVLAGLHWSTSLVYLDNIIFNHTSTVEEHFTRLEEVLTRIRQAGLKIQQRKCHLLKKKVHYLGHMVSGQGISTNPDKIRSISLWPTPTNIKEIK